MKTLKVRPRARSVKALLKRAQRGGLILRSPEGREFILAEIDDLNREIELTRRNKRLIRLLDERAAQEKTVGLAEVKAQLGLE
ncbi:MAG: hypothetical protein FJ279_29410 [Planctomycetes bacterium]|nr:hypothetical protein [Planctomycetota bacterium]MBM4082823.1 hypothetical protein [Planctomycetota bacterium]